jgi:hypothetical protein
LSRFCKFLGLLSDEQAALSVVHSQNVFWPLGINGSQNNDKKMKWLVEPIGVLVLYGALLRYERKLLRCA